MLVLHLIVLTHIVFWPKNIFYEHFEENYKYISAYKYLALLILKPNI